MQAYLTFNGNCAQAFAFYAQALDGKITFSHTFAQTPMAAEFPPEALGRIMHTSMEAMGMTIMGSDSMPGTPHEGFKGFSLTVQGASVEHGQQLFDKLVVGGQATMPFAPTFWAKGFGMLIDQFGVPWMVNCEH